MSVYRIFVEKKPAYAVASEELREDLRSALGIELLELLSLIHILGQRRAAVVHILDMPEGQ